MKVSSQGRIEPHNAVYRLEPSAAGRVVRSLLNLDEEVKQGDLLIEFDTRCGARRSPRVCSGSSARSSGSRVQLAGLDLVERADAPRRRRARCTAELHSASGLVTSLSSLGTLHGDSPNRPSLAISHVDDGHHITW
jgi:hypothetical protein